MLMGMCRWVRCWLLGVGLSLVSSIVMGQEYDSERIFSGIVIDAQTSEPLVDVVLRVGKKAYGADEVGRIGAFATVGDTLHFSHVGYMPESIVVVDSMYVHNIFSVKMSRDTVYIPEVVVLPRPMRLAENARFMPLNEDVYNEIAKYNFSNSTYVAKTQSPKVWDAEMNQKSMLNRYQSEQINRHMLSSDQMVGISTSAIFMLINMIRKKGGKSESDIKPVDESEVRYLLGRR